MTVVCPRGHESQTTDYCDQCGALIVGGPSPGGGATQELPVLEEAYTSPAARREGLRMGSLDRPNPAVDRLPRAKS